MIYTITFNPSLDYIVTLDKEFNNNEINRVKESNLFPGGKGINTSLVLNKLKTNNKALIFLDNDFGHIISNKIKDQNLDFKSFNIDIGNRINVKVNETNNNFEINGLRIKLSEKILSELMTYLKENLKENDTLMLMGSLSNNDIGDFKNILDIAKTKKANIVFDFESEYFIDLLSYNPLLIKPNKYELETIFNIKINYSEEIIKYGKELLNLGVKNVLISLGKEGAYLLTENKEIYKADPIKINMINPVGSGDSTIAGFISEYINSNDYLESFKLAIACGTATANNEWLASIGDIEKFKKQVKITKLS